MLMMVIGKAPVNFNKVPTLKLSSGLSGLKQARKPRLESPTVRAIWAILAATNKEQFGNWIWFHKAPLLVIIANHS